VARAEKDVALQPNLRRFSIGCVLNKALGRRVAKP
jgi:hypothetical protein